MLRDETGTSGLIMMSMLCMLLHVFEENENGADAGAGNMADELDGGILVDEGFDPRQIIEEVDDGDLPERGNGET